jgi:hypothetical protein
MRTPVDGRAVFPDASAWVCAKTFNEHAIARDVLGHG